MSQPEDPIQTPPRKLFLTISKSPFAKYSTQPEDDDSSSTNASLSPVEPNTAEKIFSNHLFNSSDSSFTESSDDEDDLYSQELYQRIENFLDNEQLEITLPEPNLPKSPVITLSCPKLRAVGKLNTNLGPSFLARRSLTILKSQQI